METPNPTNILLKHCINNKPNSNNHFNVVYEQRYTMLLINDPNNQWKCNQSIINVWRAVTIIICEKYLQHGKLLHRVENFHHILQATIRNWFSFSIFIKTAKWKKIYFKFPKALKASARPDMCGIEMPLYVVKFIWVLFLWIYCWSWTIRS